MTKRQIADLLRNFTCSVWIISKPVSCTSTGFCRRQDRLNRDALTQLLESHRVFKIFFLKLGTELLIRGLVPASHCQISVSVSGNFFAVVHVVSYRHSTAESRDPNQSIPFWIWGGNCGTGADFSVNAFSIVNIVLLVFDTHSFNYHRRHKIVASVSVRTHNSAVLLSVNHLINVFEEASCY